MTAPAHLRATRATYDTVAESYARLLPDVSAETPRDLAMLAAFAGRVGARGPVADLGCGAGRMTAHLRSLGVTAFGLDLSPGMVQVARRTHPGLRFGVASLTGLPLRDRSVAGVLAWYSVIHTPPELLPVVVAEFARVLVPDGRLLLGFHVGDGRRDMTTAYGHAVSCDAYLLRPEHVAGLLERTGFTLEDRLVRAPENRERRPQASLLAVSPSPG